MNTENHSNEVLDYWERNDVESMYDKHLLKLEIDLISKHIPPASKILDAGCGEGEGTLEYSSIKGVSICAADFSQTRLKKARQRLRECKNVQFKRVDFLGEYILDNDFDVVISQRFLINLQEWTKQQKIIIDLLRLLKPGGKLILLEGSKAGLDSLNEFRAALEMQPIPPKWHNLFFDDDLLAAFMQQNGSELLTQEGLGTYFLLTRGIRPALDEHLNWDHRFNCLAASPETRRLLGMDETRFSRLKLWVFRK